MDKAAKIFNLIGYIFEILIGVILLFFFVMSIIILMPNSKDIIIEGINNKTITSDPHLTLEENVQVIIGLFIVAAIITGSLASIFITESILSIIIHKKGFKQGLLIASLILAAMSLNALLIVGNILALKCGEVETITVS